MVAKQFLNRTEILHRTDAFFETFEKSSQDPGADLETTGNEQEATYVCERLSRT